MKTTQYLLSRNEAIRLSGWLTKRGWVRFRKHGRSYWRHRPSWVAVRSMVEAVQLTRENSHLLICKTPRNDFLKIV